MPSIELDEEKIIPDDYVSQSRLKNSGGGACPFMASCNFYSNYSIF